MIIVGPQRDLLVPVGNGQYLHIDGHVVGVDGRTRALHAVDSDAIHLQLRSKSRRTTYDTVCGKRARIYGYPGPDGSTMTALWPPRLSTLRPGVSRCEVCHDVAGRKRPSAYFPAVSNVDEREVTS